MSWPILTLPKKRKPVAGRGFLVDPDHRLDLRVVGGDAAADQAEGGGEAVEEVDLGVQVLVFEDVLGGVEAGRAGADDGDAKGVLWASDLAHGERGRIGNVEWDGVSRAPARRRRPRWGCRRARRAPCATDIATQVKIGVSRSVYSLDSVGRSSLTRSRNIARVVALEADDELLVVEPVGVGRVDRDLRVAAADLDVAFHDPAALLRRQPVPAPLLDHRVEEEVLALGGADLRPRLLLGVGRAFGHREERVGRLGPFRQAALAEHDVEGVDVVEVRALAEQDQVDVAARSYG